MVSELHAAADPTVILYGGAFDPPHVGHRLLVQRARDRFPKARLWISPTPTPAGAALQHKSPAASYEQRLEMCRLNFAAELKSGSVEISLIEAQLPAPHYTIRTLEHCQKNLSPERWAVLIGLDQLEQFSKWREPIGILRLADLIVVSRDREDSLVREVFSLAQKLSLEVEDLGNDKMRWRNLSTFIYLLPGCVSDAASRDVRNDPNLALKKGWLAPELADFIQQHGIYTK